MLLADVVLSTEAVMLASVLLTAEVSGGSWEVGSLGRARIT